ncbi:MAG TPA: NADPH-dependent FMN reductase [Labilithrix sp.]|nr:NADPH-dependent FMN reductase [Labilithrix sp.]
MTESSNLRVLGISGSLRQGSFNTAVLRAAVELAPADMTIEIGDFREVPLYDDDVRAAGLPPAVEKLRDAIAAADAILIVTPEYNYSVPGGLKNAIDWASRPPNQPFAGKPLAIMGASGGPSGTMRAQYHLRQIAVFLDMHPLNKPEVFVRAAQGLIDGEGRLTDEPTRKVIADQLVALAAWTRRLKG